MLVGEVLLFEPDFEVSPGAKGGVDKANACVALLIHPGDFSGEARRTLTSGKCEADEHPPLGRDWPFQTEPDPTLAEIEQVGIMAFAAAATGNGDRQIQGMPVVAKAPIQDHVAGGGEGVDCLFHGDWFFEDEAGG